VAAGADLSRGGMGLTCAAARAESSDDSRLPEIDVRRLMVQKSWVFPKRRLGCATSPEAAKSAFARGQCLLFLEGASNVPYPDVVHDLTCSAVSSKSHGKPYVRAYAMRNGGIVGQMVEWPARRWNNTPTWCSTQSLGISFAEKTAANLRIEVFDEQTQLSSIEIKLGDVPLHSPVTQQLEQKIQTRNHQPSSVSFQVLDSRAFLERRTVFFVRHGESVWNKAQEQLQLNEMVSTMDHPLSAKGRAQAESLSQRIAKAAARGRPELAGLLRPEAVYVSPLTRAIQTAVIALGPAITQAKGHTNMFLMANAREKQNFGGLDSRPTMTGIGVLQRSLDELKALYQGDEAEIIETFNQLHFDVRDVEGIWWEEAASENKDQLQVRMDEFMSQLLYSPHQSVVVVGHSHFFREVFRRYLSSDFKDQNNKLATEITKQKLMNCGVARLELDPTRGVGGEPIMNVQLVLETTLSSDGGLLACCSAHSAGLSMEEEWDNTAENNAVQDLEEESIVRPLRMNAPVRDAALTVDKNKSR